MLGFVLGAWPYWLPVLALALGFGVGVAFQKIRGLEQLARLAKSLGVGENWRPTAEDAAGPSGKWRARAARPPLP